MKVVVITGGASGLGAATVQFFVEQGWGVAVIDQAECPVDFDKIPKKQGLFLQSDVRDAGAMMKAISETIEHFGRLDAVVASAGVYESHSILDVSERDWQRVMQTNAYGVVTVVQAALPHLKKSSSIVLIASDQVFSVKRNSFAYSVSKAAVAQMTKSMALDLASRGIRVNAVSPGTIKTPMTEAFVGEWARQEFGGDIQAVWDAITEEYPLRRVGQPMDIAPLIYFLVSDAASFMTGAIIPIDGGLTI